MSNQNDKIVLIVNDSPDQREIMQIIFQQAGYRALTASSGREGFQFAESTQLELIVSDVMMPDGDGIELCRSSADILRYRKFLQVFPDLNILKILSSEQIFYFQIFKPFSDLIQHLPARHNSLFFYPYIMSMLWVY